MKYLPEKLYPFPTKEEFREGLRARLEFLRKKKSWIEEVRYRANMDDIQDSTTSWDETQESIEEEFMSYSRNR